MGFKGYALSLFDCSIHCICDSPVLAPFASIVLQLQHRLPSLQLLVLSPSHSNAHKYTLHHQQDSTEMSAIPAVPRHVLYTNLASEYLYSRRVAMTKSKKPNDVASPGKANVMQLLSECFHLQSRLIMLQNCVCDEYMPLHVCQPSARTVEILALVCEDAIVICAWRSKVSTLYLKHLGGMLQPHNIRNLCSHIDTLAPWHCRLRHRWLDQCDNDDWTEAWNYTLLKPACTLLQPHTYFQKTFHNRSSWEQTEKFALPRPPCNMFMTRWVVVLLHLLRRLLMFFWVTGKMCWISYRNYLTEIIKHCFI